MNILVSFGSLSRATSLGQWLSKPLIKSLTDLQMKVSVKDVIRLAVKFLRLKNGSGISYADKIYIYISFHKCIRAFFISHSVEEFFGRIGISVKFIIGP